MRIAVCALFALGSLWAQGADDCKPSPLNIPNAPYPCVHPDRRVTFRVSAPDAQKVQVRLGGAHDMTKGAGRPVDGHDSAAGRRLPLLQHRDRRRGRGRPGHPHVLRLGLGQQRHRDSRAGRGRGVLLRERRSARPGGQRWYYSKVTGKWRRCYVYTPPEYEANHAANYPVLYLLHGWGENEQGWHIQGHVDFIMDNLIAEKKAKPMIVVMDNLNAVKPGEDASLYARARHHRAQDDGGCPARGRRGRGAAPAGGRGGFPTNWGRVFTDMMFTDLIPMVEHTYRVAPGRENRAMAGLSMGGMQSFMTVLGNIDKFAYLGGFSGSSGGRGGFDPKTSNNGVFADAAAFNKKMKVLFLGSARSKDRARRISAKS